jgi:hypothetical protein
LVGATDVCARSQAHEPHLTFAVLIAWVKPAPQLVLRAQAFQLPYLPGALLANLTALEVIDFGGEGHNSNAMPSVMGGSLPPELSTLANLTVLGVTGPLNGTIPATYSSWAKLKAFRVANTKLTGTIPASLFPSWPALTNFSIDGANLTGTIPPMFNNTQLQEFGVQNTPVSNGAGATPAWFVDPRAANLTAIKAIAFGAWGWAGL